VSQPFVDTFWPYSKTSKEKKNHAPQKEDITNLPNVKIFFLFFFCFFEEKVY